MARGKGRHAAHHTGADEDGPFCPLCIEPLDEYEQTWLPCGCGYQVCAFCYGRLNLESKKQCPGCRQEYGTSPVTLPDGGEVINRGTSATTPVPTETVKHNGSGSELPVAVGDRPETETPEIPGKDTPAVNLEPDRDVSLPNGIAATPVPTESNDDAGAKASTPDTAKIEPHPQDVTLSHKSETEEEEETQSKPKIQPTRIKTRPWGTTESGQQNPNLLNQNPPLASQGWPTLGTDANGGTSNIVHSDSRLVQPVHRAPAQIAETPENSNQGAKTVASEQLRAFLDLAQRRQQQNTIPNSHADLANSVSHGPQQNSGLRPPDGRAINAIKPPPGYDHPLPHWGSNIQNTQNTQNIQNGQIGQVGQIPNLQAGQSQANAADAQEKFTKWWQTVSSGSRAPNQNSYPSQNSYLPGNDSAHDLMRQAADAHGLAYPNLSPSPSPTPEGNGEQYKPHQAFNIGANGGLGVDSDNNDSDKSMEKLYSIWPAHARSTQSDSGGPSSLSSTHNMWAVHNKHSNGVSALWNPQFSEPIPDSVQELWAKDMPSAQASQPPKANPLQQENFAQNQSLNYQRDNFSPRPDYLPPSQSEDQYSGYNTQNYNTSQGYNTARNHPIGNGLNRSHTQTPVSAYSQPQNSRPYANQMGVGMNGLGQSLNQQSSNLNQHGLGMSQAISQGLGQSGAQLNDGQNQQYGNQASLQAAQALLQGLQLQAAMKQQYSNNQQTNQQNMFQANQQSRYPQQQQQPQRGFPQASAAHNLGLNGLINTSGLSQHQNLGQQNLNQQNLNQGLANLGISPAYAAQLLNQLGISNGQQLLGNSTQNGLFTDTRNGRNPLQGQQYGLGNQIYGNGNAINNNGNLGGANLGANLGANSADINMLRLQQALQASNVQNNLSNDKLQYLQNIAAQQAAQQLQERQKQQQLLDLYNRQQQSQVFPQSQGARQEQSRFAAQFGGQRNVGQQYQQNFNQGPNQILQQNRLGRSSSPAGFHQNAQFGNRNFQQ